MPTHSPGPRPWLPALGAGAHVPCTTTLSPLLPHSLPNPYPPPTATRTLAPLGPCTPMGCSISARAQPLACSCPGAGAGQNVQLGPWAACPGVLPQPGTTLWVDPVWCKAARARVQLDESFPETSGLSNLAHGWLRYSRKSEPGLGFDSHPPSPPPNPPLAPLLWPVLRTRLALSCCKLHPCCTCATAPLLAIHCLGMAVT